MHTNKILWFERNLPLLKKEKRFFAKLNLSKILLISVQHLCSTTYSLFNALFDLQLHPQNLFVLGKCYSTDPKVYSRLQTDLVNVSSSSLHFKSHIPYDLDFEKSCDELLQQVISSRNLDDFEKIIILDDGGHLIERAHLMMPNHLNIIGIEQTSSGYNRLKNEAIFFPIINLARSWLKLNYESPIIVKLAQRKLLSKLLLIANHSKKILLIGYGALGEQTYQSLRNNFEVTSFDLDQEKSMIKIADFKNRLNEFDVIIGCTGTTSLKLEDFKFLKKPVVLASISSSDREFEAVEFRKLQNQFRNCHTDITNEEITLLNSGFPITFDDDYDGIDTDDFQLTRALIFTSICQAFLTKSQLKGFVEIQNEHQNRILKNFEENNN